MFKQEKRLNVRRKEIEAMKDEAKKARRTC